LQSARAFFEPTARGSRFTIEHLPPADRPALGSVVFLHAFAEEMNKSRRMVAVTARQLAAAGWRVTLFDLHGCGDSSGDFGDATWEHWCSDAREVVQKGEQSGKGPLWFWAMRAGALLAPPLLEQVPEANLLLWQPVTSGQQQLTQFLRLKAAQSALAGGSRVGVSELRARLASGTPTEVAGYMISPELAAGLDSARLALPDAFSGRVEWLEVSALTPPSLSPAAQSLCGQWHAAGKAVRSAAVSGAPFWQTQEIAECPALAEATLEALQAR
jgi:exosortase A-associated hydrolase 2